MTTNVTQADDEGLSEALFALSAHLKASGFLDDDVCHRAYERVVAEFQALSTRSAIEADVREACAKIAEDNATISTDVGEGDAWIALRIAKAIRTGAPPRSADADGWQSIETAPKDGCILLASLAVANAGAGPVWNITVGYWDAEFESVLTDDEVDAYRGAWTDDSVASWGYEERTELCPTHWRPLPAPPSSETANPIKGDDHHDG